MNGIKETKKGALNEDEVIDSLLNFNELFH
jgi:hypothetical protein